jgi:hypothetical protein
VSYSLLAFNAMQLRAECDDDKLQTSLEEALAWVDELERLGCCVDF